MDKKTIIDITSNVVTDFWKKRLIDAGIAHTNAFFATLNKMPLTSTEKDYYQKIYTEELQKKLTASLNPEQQEHFKKEIEEKLKD
jgi:hypothetical protein